MTTDQPTPIQVLLVAEHEVMRRALGAVLDHDREISVVGEADTVASAVSEAARLKPDVVVMDLRLPDGSGVEACRQICGNDESSKVLILASYADEEALFSAVLAGASGYVLKSLDLTGILRAILDVGRGRSFVDPQLTTRIRERRQRDAAPCR